MALLIACAGVGLFGLMYLEVKKPIGKEAMTTTAEGVGCGVALAAGAIFLLTVVIWYAFTHLEFHP